MMPDLDARHLLCPLPVLRVQERVAQLAGGEVLTVRCTDPGALNDIPAWCRIEGHEVLQARTDDAGEVLVTLRVGSRAGGDPSRGGRPR